MEKTGTVIIGMLVAFMVCPVLLAQETAKPVILIYHGPKTGAQELRQYGQALAELIESDPRMAGKAEIVLVGDQDLMNTLLYFPQVKCVVMAMTTWELKADRIVRSTLWYFNQGGGIVGLGNAGYGSVTGVLNGSVFPIFGNQYRMVDPTIYTDPVTGKRVIERTTMYRLVQAHQITEGVPQEFVLKEKRYVIHMNTTTVPPKYQPRQPSKGTYTKVYEETQLSAPLVVVYEENGTSVTFAGTDQMSTNPADETYFGNFTNDANFKKLFQNSVYYVWSKETKYENAMARAQEEFAKMEQERAELKARVEQSQKSEKGSKLMRSVLLIVVGVVLIAVISYYCFVIPARQARAAQGETAPSEAPKQEGG